MISNYLNELKKKSRPATKLILDSLHTIHGSKNCSSKTTLPTALISELTAY